MSCVGTLVDVLGIIAGGAAALIFGRMFKDHLKSMMMFICGLAIFIIGITGIMQGMLTISDGMVSVRGTIPLLISLVAGAAVGEIIDLESRVELWGKHLQKHMGNSDDGAFADGLIKASMAVGIGAMAVIGPITEGLYGDHSVMFAKAAVDFVIIMVLTIPYGKGCLFAAIPVGIMQAGLTLLAFQTKNLMTNSAIASLTTTGSVMIMCIGINLIWDKKIRVINMLPMVLIGVFLTYVPGLR